MIEYRVKPITRYIVTKYVNENDSVYIGEKGVFESKDCACDVALGLARGDSLRSIPGIEPCFDGLEVKALGSDGISVIVKT